jgi:phosphohistidine phosphatase
MLLYLVQHGEAKKEEDDPQRGLTDKGSRDVARTAISAQARGVKVSIIHHSGKTRALQTAQILADHLKPGKGPSPTDALAPMDDPDVWAGRIAGMNEDVMLVGHLPYMAKLAGLLLCGDKERRTLGTLIRDEPLSSFGFMHSIRREIYACRAKCSLGINVPKCCVCGQTHSRPFTRHRQ